MQAASWLAWKHMGIINSSLQAIALAAKGNKNAAVAAVRKVRNRAMYCTLLCSSASSNINGQLITAGHVY